MAGKKKNFIPTPIGTAVWPHLHSPDTKFDKDGGVYRVQVAYDAESDEATTLVKQINAWVDQAIAEENARLIADGKKAKKPESFKRADLPFKMELNDEGEETGRMLFNFKQKAKGKTREGVTFERRVALYLKGGVPLPKDKQIAGGSLIQVSYEANPFYTGGLGAGVSLRLEAVMVHELVEWQGRDASGYGFDVDDTATCTANESSEDTDTESTDDGDDNGDF
jgi:hypothetical protein